MWRRMSEVPQPQNTGKNNQLPGLLAVSGSTFIWGFGYVVAKYSLLHLSPYALLFWRTFFSAVIAISVFYISGKRIRDYLPFWKEFVLLAAGGVAFNQLLWLVGLTYTTPSHSVLIYTLLPFFTGLFATMFLNERMDFRKWVGIVVAFIGAIILLTEKGVDFRNKYFLGDIITLGALIFWALYTAFSKRTVEKLGTTATMGMTFLFGLIMVSPLGFVWGFNKDVSTIDPVGWSSILYVIFISTMVALYLYTFSLKHLPSSTVASFIYLQPVVAAVASVLLLGEKLSLMFFVAAFLIFAGLLSFLPRKNAG